jgi:hypothetical protein
MKLYDKNTTMGMCTIKRNISRSMLIGLYPIIIDEDCAISGMNYYSGSPWYDQNIEIYYNTDFDRETYSIYEHKSFSYKSRYKFGFTHMKTKTHVKLGSISSSRALFMSLKRK